MDTGLSEGSDKQIKIRVTLLFENDTLYFKDIFLCKENWLKLSSLRNPPHLVLRQILISPHIHFSLGCPEYRLIQFLILCHILLTVSLKFVSACIYVLPTLSEYVSPHSFSKICINLHLCDVLPTPGLLAVGFCLRVASGCEQAGIMPARKPRMGHFNCLNPEQDVPTI